MRTLSEDVRGFPGYVLGRRRLWVPFGILSASFVLAVLLESGHVPSALERPTALLVQLTLPPSALFVFFIGGALADRRGYLLGAALGLVDGVFWLMYVTLADASSVGLGDVPAVILIATAIGTVAAGLAGLVVWIAQGRPGATVRDPGTSGVDP